MAATFPFLRESPGRLELNVTAGTIINPGDFVWWNGTTLKPVGTALGLVNAWASESKARRDAISRCVGIADFQCNADDKLDKTYAVRQAGIYEVPCTSFTPYVGDLVGFEKDTGGNYLYSQQLQKVLNPYDAIGVVIKDHAAASTTVQVMFFGAYVFRFASLIQRMTLGVPAALYTAASNHLLNFNFGHKVRILAAEAIVEVLTAGACTFTLVNVANSLDDTLVVPDASAVGVVVRQEMVAAVNPAYLDFEHDTDFDITSDATPTAGSVTLAVEYMSMPLVA